MPALGRQLSKRRSRFGVPRVNQDPRPPNEPKGPGAGLGSSSIRRKKGKRRRTENRPYKPNKGGLGAGPGGSPSPLGGKPLIPGGTGRPDTSKPSGPLGSGGGGGSAAPPAGPQPTPFNEQTIAAQMAALNGNPANVLAFSSFTPGPGQVDPRDPTYWRNVHNLLANTQQQYGEMQLAGQRSATDYETGVQDRTTERGRAQRALAEEMMRSGLSRSGYATRSDAEGTTDFLREMEDYQTGQTREESDRRTAQSRLLQEFITGERGYLEDALTAFEQQQLEEAEEGAPLYGAEGGAGGAGEDEGEGGGGKPGKGKKGKRKKGKGKKRRRRIKNELYAPPGSSDADKQLNKKAIKRALGKRNKKKPPPKKKGKKRGR